MSNKTVSEKSIKEWRMISIALAILVVVILITSSLTRNRNKESPVFYEDLAGRCLPTLGVYKSIAVVCPGAVCTIHTMNNFTGVHAFWLLDTNDCTVESIFNF